MFYLEVHCISKEGYVTLINLGDLCEQISVQKFKHINKIKDKIWFIIGLLITYSLT